MFALISVFIGRHVFMATMLRRLFFVKKRDILETFHADIQDH